MFFQQQKEDHHRIFDTGEKNVQRQHMELLYMLSGLQRKIDRDIGSM